MPRIKLLFLAIFSCAIHHASAFKETPPDGPLEREETVVADITTHPICTHITSLLSQPIRRNEIHEMCREEMDGKMIHEICQEACDEFVVDSRLLKSYREEILEFDFNIFSKFLAYILFVRRDSDSHAIYFHSLL